MKINKYNTRDASNVPGKLSLIDPFSGEVIIDDVGKTLDFYVYGMQSDMARNAKKARDRKYGKLKSLTDEQASQSGAEFLADITQGWSGNVEDDDGPIPVNRENAIGVFLNEDWIAKQVLDFASNLTNYSPKHLSESASTSAGSHGSKARQKASKEQGENN
jgi:hypothetical protein